MIIGAYEVCKISSSVTRFKKTSWVQSEFKSAKERHGTAGTELT